MRLYLMRHGRAASRADWTAADAERPLTDEGRARTASAAHGLAALEVAPAAAIASPYVRARETAAIVAAELGMPLELEAGLEPGADLAALASVLTAHADAAELLMVGHEPDLSTLVGELIAGRRGAQIEMKKGACACVDLPASAVRKASGAAERLAGAGTLRWLFTASQLARLGAPASTTRAGGGDAQHGEPDAGDGPPTSDRSAPSASHRSRPRRSAAGGDTNSQ